jgi:hypothetical protein
MTDFIKKVNLIWMLDFAENYQFDKLGKCYNVTTGREIKQTVVGYTLGFCIKGKFYSIKRLRRSLVKIEKTNCPF